MKRFSEKIIEISPAVQAQYLLKISYTKKFVPKYLAPNLKRLSQIQMPFRRNSALLIGFHYNYHKVYVSIKYV